MIFKFKKKSNGIDVWAFKSFRLQISIELFKQQLNSRNWDSILNCSRNEMFFFVIEQVSIICYICKQQRDCHPQISPNSTFFKSNKSLQNCWNKSHFNICLCVPFVKKTGKMCKKNDTYVFSNLKILNLLWFQRLSELFSINFAFRKRLRPLACL